jgi:hypothetical protein
MVAAERAAIKGAKEILIQKGDGAEKQYNI